MGLVKKEKRKQKIDAYYPEDKLKEYTKFASKTGELLDSETKLITKTYYTKHQV